MTLPVAAPAPEPRLQPDLRSDYRTIVIGSGISGLFVALEARHLGPVLVLTKGSIDDCNTRWAQGGIAAALGPLDSPEQHLADTIAAGAGLVDAEAARILCYEAPPRIRDLIRYGVAFDSLGGEVALGREAAHSQSRILHAGGDRTGAAIETALGSAALDPTITILDYTLATGLTKDANGHVTGVEAIDFGSGRAEVYEAPAVVIATGGAGQLFSHTTNPEIATGDGIALAFAAGAEVADLEFYQFHPTALRVEGAPAFLISEAVRGEGAVLRNTQGVAFMARYHTLRELAPRDIVARAIVAEMRATGADHVLLDCTALKSIDLASRFPGIFAFCKSVGIDMREEPIPVAPAAHYLMGGVRTDVHGRTTLPGLYACGEVACTGLHGANRLASNSLMETVVFGKRVVDALGAEDQGSAPSSPDAITIGAEPRQQISKAELQRLLWECAGIEREVRGLERGLRQLTPAGEDSERLAHRSRGAWESAQMHTVGRLMLEAALRRTESRGAHYRSDYSERDDRRWQRRQVFRRAD